MLIPHFCAQGDEPPSRGVEWRQAGNLPNQWPVGLESTENRDRP
ncbi:hypothetical protein [Leptolyngbya iicbica]